MLELRVEQIPSLREEEKEEEVEKETKSRV